MKNNIILKIMVSALVLSTFFSFCVFKENCEHIEDKVLRLHIMANSDCDYDQQLKLIVRDEVVTYVATLLKDSQSKEQTMQIIKDNKENIEKVAQSTITNHGYNYIAKLSITNMLFDTRVYDNITMPSGWYDAVRITIGSGQGHNWWCVLYPSLCLSACAEENTQSSSECSSESASNGNSSELDNVLDDNEQKIVTQEQDYSFKFKIVEFFEWLWNCIFG